jgi:hypothetical protein
VHRALHRHRNDGLANLNTPVNEPLQVVLRPAVGAHTQSSAVYPYEDWKTTFTALCSVYSRLRHCNIDVQTFKLVHDFRLALPLFARQADIAD